MFRRLGLVLLTGIVVVCGLILLSHLSPGTASDSNTIDVIVLTNNATGYTLNATVGDNTNYNTRNLIHEVDGSSAIFSSINFGSSYPHFPLIIHGAIRILLIMVLIRLTLSILHQHIAME